MTSPRLGEWFEIGIDAVFYVLATSGVAVVLAGIGAALAFESFWNGVVTMLFLLGWLVFGYATVLAWPASRRPSRTPIGKLGELGSGRSSGDRREGLLERQVVRLEPERWSRAPSDRLSPAAKLYLSSLVILSVSVFVERVVLL